MAFKRMNMDVVKDVMQDTKDKKSLKDQSLYQDLKHRLVREASTDPNYELKLFVVPFRCSINKSLGGDKTDTFNEIRGITGVTTVTDIEGTLREDDKNYYSTVLVKFELTAGRGPLDFRSKVLIPHLKKIKGLVVYNIGGVDQVVQ